MTYWSYSAIEDQAASRLAEFTRRTGRRIEPPIPIDLVAEVLFDLRFCREPIEAVIGHRVFGCLHPNTKTVTVNEAERPLFDRTPGLERFTIGHEIGHWDLFESETDRSSGKLFASGSSPARMSCRTASGAVGKFIAGAWADDDKYEVLAAIRRRCDSPVEATAVNKYAGALLMPRELLLDSIAGVRLDGWRELYPIRDRFDVSIRALAVRLQELKKVYVTKDGRLYPGTREEHNGQQRIF